MHSKKIFIPMDRLGVVNVQEDPMNAIAFVNGILKDKKVSWLTKPCKFYTERFPEGHLYAQGGFFIDYDPECAESAEKQNISFDIIENDCCAGPLKKTRIALYNGKGAADFCINPLVEVLNLAGFGFEFLSDNDMRKEELLNGFDILLVPGGPDAGESYYWGMGSRGYDNIKQFVNNNGQYFGICAGAYLPLKSYSKDNIYWLGMVDATDDQDLDYWRTGTGFTRVEILSNTHPVSAGVAAGGVNTIDVVYWEGPAIKVLNDKVKVHAVFKDFIASGHDAEKPQWDLLDNTPAIDSINNWYNVLTKERFDNHLKGRAAIVESEFNGNKMLLYSPHAEFGNIGITERNKSQTFQLISNALFYLSIKR